MTGQLNNPIFHDATKARAWLEALLWSNGRPCGYCGVVDQSSPLKTRPGYYQCKACRKQFTVMVGTVFERSHIPLNKWLMAGYLLCASKKGISAHQIHRLLGITYKSAWFMCHRLREAMREGYIVKNGPMGGEGKTVEADEAYIGPSIAKDTRLQRKGITARSNKHIVFTLVERGGKAKSFKIAKASMNTLKGILQDQTHYKTRLMTDDSNVYHVPVRSFEGGHHKVNHSKRQYVAGIDTHTNTVENYFSVLKRGITGTYQHISEQHLHRYLAEFDFRYSNRAALEVDDRVRTERALLGIVGKRLTYRRIDEASHA